MHRMPCSSLPRLQRLRQFGLEQFDQLVGPRELDAEAPYDIRVDLAVYRGTLVAERFEVVDVQHEHPAFLAGDGNSRALDVLDEGQFAENLAVRHTVERHPVQGHDVHAPLDENIDVPRTIVDVRDDVALAVTNLRGDLVDVLNLHGVEVSAQLELVQPVRFRHIPAFPRDTARDIIPHAARIR